MSFVVYIAMIVTGYNQRHTRKAKKKAQELFGKDQVTNIMTSPVNGRWTFFIGPDSSKVGWDESDKAMKARDEMVAWLREQNEKFEKDFYNRTSHLMWSEVQYGSDTGSRGVLRDYKKNARYDPDDGYIGEGG